MVGTMSMRHSISIAIVVAALAGCSYEPYPPVTVAALPKASSEELRWAVEAALAARNWTVSSRESGKIGAYVVSRGSGDHAVIEIDYRGGTIDIRCVQQQVSRDRYDRWIQLLSSEIQKQVAQLGMKLARPPAQSPPPSDAGN